MFDEDFPLSKRDIHYDPETQEITLDKDKFDALVGFIQGLVGRLEEAEDDRAVAEFRVRRAGSEARIFHDLVKGAPGIIQGWLEAPEHTIKELSERTEIPYATCHRILKSRLSSGRISVDDLQRMLDVAAEPTKAKPVGKRERHEIEG